MRGCVTGLIVVILLVAAALGGAAYLLNEPRALPETAPVAVSDEAAASFDRKVATIRRADGPITVEIDDREATSKLTEALAANPETPRIDNPQVNFRDGRIYVSGTARDAPLPVKIVVAGRVEAREGRLVATVEQIDSGRIPLPAAIRDQITGAATDLDDLNRALPIHVTEVYTLDGRLVLTGRPK